jgi:hypothetical protein
VTAGHVLEVLDECIVHRSAAECADDREGLRGDLLGHHESEARSDLGYELQEDRRSLLDDAAFGLKPAMSSSRNHHLP